MPRVTFLNEKKSISVGLKTTILEAARRTGVVIESPCNGMGKCGKCTVKAGGSNDVLSCQTKVIGDIAVETRDYDAVNESMKILAEGNSFQYGHKPYVRKKLINGNGVQRTEVYGGKTLIGVEEGNTINDTYAVALDIGTTTIVAALIDLCSGEQADSESELNPQTAYAQDVLSRIHFASKDDGLQTLFSIFICCLNTMIDTIATRLEISKSNIYEIVFSGNTTMLHLATRTNPYSLGQYPYRPRISGGSFINARDLGVAISQFGLIYLPPVISAYVGADITSGILVSQLDEIKGTVLFIDIGTNGEMALAVNGKIAASSTAAGPAFEGMNISCGMRASRGAIEYFVIHEGRMEFNVIGGTEAAGICGSGLLDITGELVKAGVIAPNGRFVQPDDGSPYSDDLRKCMRDKDGKKAFFITSNVYLTQKDIRQIQLAKSAIRTGIEMLLAHFNLAAGDITRVEIAGSFGYHLREQSLFNIGLLPAEFAGKIYFTGNTSLSGAIAFLLNLDFMSKMRKLVQRIDTVELAKHENFDRVFVKYMSFCSGKGDKLTE
ncbi:MAG: ASKHA domain-containing protein [Spirochaetaceae bacterium]|jgi:uncharacterized 2Fe-2S/4Fe-4S cluster protein (DUF4445 family)|nr:ASKHA domain-containing protein [Spirochaetaceae bacterium]